MSVGGAACCTSWEISQYPDQPPDGQDADGDTKQPQQQQRGLQMKAKRSGFVLAGKYLH